MDLVFATALLVVAVPVLVVLVAVVRLDSAGPVVFRQRRVGRNGREFTMFKLRSMLAEAEDLREGLEAINEADGPLFKIADDPRVTRVGRWLRKLSLDELPQLFNVVQGQMSLVGPRPALPQEAATYDQYAAGRLSVKPGLTGPWQVSARHQSSFDDYLTLDLEYVRSRSLGGDLVLLARSVPAVLRGTGA